MVPSLEKALASGGSIIGYLTWFDCENASISPTNLIKLFNKYGLDEKYLPEDIKPKNAFQKACRKAMMASGQSSDTRRSVTKLIVDGTDKIVYGVVDLDVNEGKESIDPDFSDRVWLDKANLSVHWDKGHPVSKLIKQVYTTLCGEYATRDISRMIVDTFDKLAVVPLRKGGVVYFVPASFEEQMKALQNVVNEIGQCNMQVFAVGDGGDNLTSVAKAAKSQITDKLTEMKNDIKELRQSVEDGTLKGKTIENSMAVRLRRFQELKERCGILVDTLKFKAETLENEFEDVSKLLKDDLLIGIHH